MYYCPNKGACMNSERMFKLLKRLDSKVKMKNSLINVKLIFVPKNAIKRLKPFHPAII